MHASISVLEANGISVGIKHTSAIPYSEKIMMVNQHTCEYHKPPNNGFNGPVPRTNYADSQCFINYKPHNHHSKGKVS